MQLKFTPDLYSPSNFTLEGAPHIYLAPVQYDSFATNWYLYDSIRRTRIFEGDWADVIKFIIELRV